jgi:hypothetical protein
MIGIVNLFPPFEMTCHSVPEIPLQIRSELRGVFHRAVHFLLTSMTAPFACVPTVHTDSLDLEQVPLQVRDRLTQLMKLLGSLKASSMREQVHIAYEELRGPDGMRITFDAIASFLGLTRQAVFNHLHRPIHTKPIGRPKCLPPEADKMISAMITEHFARRAPVTCSFLLDSLLYFLGLGLLPDTLYHICRTLPVVKTIAAVPMEVE